MERNGYEAVIGVEVHVHLKTKSKLFCGCPVDYGAPPNTVTCPICTGAPGVLPVLNREAFRQAVRAAIALQCEIQPVTKFDRKAYWYPDLPKNFQISQYDMPFSRNGTVQFEVEGEEHRVKVRRVHLEEDAGKLMHEGSGHFSSVDLNRAGVGMIEIVTEPDLYSAAEAQEFLLELRRILRCIGVADCDMELGSMRCEPNISIRPAGSDTLGTKTEIKNLNSFRAVHDALEYEIARHTEVLSSGGKIRQETMLWDPDTGRTAVMRSKEEAMDYRYFPEPDLPPIEVKPEWLEGLRASIGELPRARRKRFASEMGLSPYDAKVLSEDRKVADYYEAVVAEGIEPKAAANWVSQDCLRVLGERKISIDELRVRPESLASLVKLIQEGAINNTIARGKVFPTMVETGKEAEQVVREQDLGEVSDESVVEDAVRQAIEKNSKAVADYKKGKKSAAQFLFGQTMKITRGRAKPDVVRSVLERILSSL